MIGHGIGYDAERFGIKGRFMRGSMSFAEKEAGPKGRAGTKQHIQLSECTL
jgi:hypothetical protein